MTDISPIVHIVVGICSDTGKPTVFGSFFSDVVAHRLKADLEGFNDNLSVESWVIGDDGGVAEALVKQDHYEDGCSVYFDDGETRGIGKVMWSDNSSEKAPERVLYRVQASDGKPNYMTGAEIKGMITSETIKNNLPL